ncbi:surface-adhesin E family protein [Parasphingopyxis lamellibrachiae]|uniref:surface-adhesin E family protein n=1 Tax=Parasphingopyxis lamellibrachiae TaxID=680125 RepID=UPI0011C0482D
MKQIGLSVALLVLGNVSAANAQQWAEAPVYIGQNSTGSVWTIRAEDMPAENDDVQIWVHIDHSSDQSTSAQTTRELYDVSCKQRTTRLIRSVRYGPDGSVLGTYDGSLWHSQNIPIVPESMGEALWNTLCAQGRSR